MDRIPNNKSKDINLCSITGCVNHRVYYYPQKNLKLCTNCWQDFLIDTNLDKIDTPDSALLTIKKIETWLSTMKKYGASYYITKIYDNFYVELGKYEQKLDEIRGKLNKAQQDDDFLEYPKIEHEALELLKQLCASNVMQNYRSYFAQMHININTNENYIEVQGQFDSEIRDKQLAKMKEVLTKELTEMNSKALEEEQKKLSDQFNQTFEDQKKRIDELEINIGVKQKSIEEHEITIRNKEELINQLNQHLEDHKKKIEELEISIKNEKKLSSKYSQINEDQKKRIGELENSVCEEKKLSNIFNQANENQKKKIDELEVNVREKQKLIDQFSQNFEDQKKKIEELGINVKEKEKKIENHVTENNNLKKEIENILKDTKCEKDKLTNENSKLIEKNEEHKKSIDKLNEQNKEYNKTIAKLTEDCKQKDNTIEGLNEDKKQNNATIDQLNSGVKEKDSLIDRLNIEKNDNEITINKFKLDNKEQEEMIDKLNEESKTQKAEIENISKCFTDLREYLSQFYKSKTGREGKTANDLYLYIDWDEASNRQALQVAKLVKLNEMHKIYFDNLEDEDSKEVLDYLVKNSPDKLNLFTFDANSGCFGSAEYYIEGIKKVASVTSKEVYIRAFRFSKSDFEQTVKASANSQRIVFCSCILNSDADFDFKGPAYATSYLSFRGVGSRSANGWKTQPERLKRIVKAISECSLKDSLNTIDVYSCNVEVAEVEKMLEEFALKDKVKVVQEDGCSLDE